MTVRGLVGAALRLFALWSVLVAFKTLTAVYALNPETWSLGFVAIVVMVEGLVFLGLWGASFQIAKWLVPEPVGSSPASLDARGLLRTGASLIGLGLLATALPDAVRWVAIDNSSVGDGDDVRIRIEFAVVFAKLAIAAFLLFKNDAIAGACLPAQRSDEALVPTSDP